MTLREYAISNILRVNFEGAKVEHVFNILSRDFFFGQFLSDIIAHIN